MKLLPALLFCAITYLYLNLASAKNVHGKIKLRLYSRKNHKHYHEAEVEEAHVLFEENTGFEINFPVILIIHGMAVGADCPFVNGLVKAYFKRGLHREYNIFAVDMPKLFQNNIFNNFYFGVLSNVQPAGETIGAILTKVIEMKLTAPEKINLVGYSIGAQVAGYAARQVLNKFGPVNYIAGLDPAGPGFHSMFGHIQKLTHVSYKDANITHFFHTNSAMCGTMDRLGTADFVFNDGNNQPGCTRETSLDCSHTRIPYVYVEAVAHPKRFIGRKCENWENFTNCQCNQNETVRISFPPDTSSHGIYYLRTNDKIPFGLGKAGAKCQDTVIPESNSKKFLISQRLKKAPSLFERNLFEKQARTDISKPKTRKYSKSNFNVHIMSGIKKIEDSHHGESN